MNEKEFSESDFILAKAMAREVFILSERLNDLIFCGGKFPIGISFRPQIHPFHIDESASLEQFKIWMRTLWMLEREFSGTVMPAEMEK